MQVPWRIDEHQKGAATSGVEGGSRTKNTEPMDGVSLLGGAQSAHGAHSVGAPILVVPRYGSICDHFADRDDDMRQRRYGNELIHPSYETDPKSVSPYWIGLGFAIRERSEAVPTSTFA